MSMSPAPERGQWLRGTRSPASRVPWGVGFFALMAMLLGGAGIVASTLLFFLAYHADTFAALPPDFVSPNARATQSSYLPAELGNVAGKHDEEVAVLQAKWLRINVAIIVSSLLLSLYLLFQGSRCWRLRPYAHHALGYAYIAMLIALAWGQLVTWKYAADFERAFQTLEDSVTEIGRTNHWKINKPVAVDGSRGWMFREWQRAQRGELGSLLPAMNAARCVLYLLAIFYLLNPGLDYDFRRANPLPPRTKLAVPAFLIEGSRSGDGNGLPNQLPTDNLSNCSPPPVPEEE